MITKPMDILEQYPIRKTKKQKHAFRADVQTYAESLGYEVTVEKGSMGAQNIVIGDPEKAKYLVTAHYDTPASIGLPNFITPTNPVTFLIYQFVIVALFFLVSGLAAYLVELVTHDFMISFWVWYIVYFGVLALMMFGPANRSNANDNTSGVVTVLETAAAMPEALRERVSFVLFDLEEAGLIGSASYRKTHKAAMEKQIVLNCDCVGDGDEIVLFPANKVKKDEALMADLESACGRTGPKTVSLHKKGFSYYPSDQKNFPYGVGIAAFHRAKGVGLYCSRIHTWRDTVLEEENVKLLRAVLTTLITSDK